MKIKNNLILAMDLMDLKEAEKVCESIGSQIDTIKIGYPLTLAEGTKTIQIFNLKEKEEYIKEVATLEHEEWAENPEENKKERIERKTNKIKNNLSNKDFCKLILLKNEDLVGFISIFPNDCDECPELTPWYATMYIKKQYRGKGYSKILNESILNEATKRGYKEIFLKTELSNYYEKFGAIYIRKLKNGEKLYKIEL